MSSSATVAVLGAGGTMGLPMARNIAKAGIEVLAWNRSREKAEPLAEDGVAVAHTAAEAASGASMLLTILSDTNAVISTMEGSDGALAGADRGATWLQMSTVGIEGTERCATLADQHGLVLVDAPVVGTKQPAEQGMLTVLASGPEEARDRCEPIFDAIGQKTIWLGEAGTGTRMKLVINAWLVSLVEGLGETIAFAEGIDIDPAQFLETISGGPIDNAYTQMKGRMMVERSFDPAFKLELAAKDAGLVLEAAQRHDLDLPMLEAIRARLAEAAEQHGEKDMSATYLASAPNQAAGR
ncbi:MAG TPA: NAD(P)-dependent oxidoreductase [Solirubrobacterales bacterium]|nr:NAD(P)-dependent oxidoreductase [Solirubrobacterales bacterium]